MHNAFDAGAGLGVGLMAVFLYGVFIIAILGFGIFIWWRIFTKIGMHGAWSLLMIIHLASFIMKIILAFTDWPIEKKLKEKGGT